MMDMNHIAARLEVIEPRGALTRPNATTRPAATCEVRFSQHTQTGVWEMESSMEWGDRDVGTRSCEICTTICDGEFKFVIEHECTQPLSGTRAVCGDDDSFAIAKKFSNSRYVTCAIADDWSPACAFDERSLGALWRCIDCPERTGGCE
jgi:hypothetical protein